MLQNTQTHIIRRQILEVEVGTKLPTWQWQERLSQFANGPLARRLAELFDEQSHPGVTQRIDRLELTLNIEGNENWESELLEQLSRQVLELLPDLGFKDADSRLPDLPGITPQEAIVNTFFHFLETGLLPWWTNTETTLNFAVKLKEVLKDGISPNLKSKFQELIRSQSLRQRLVLQFDQELLSKLALIFLDITQTEIAEWKMFVKAMTSISARQKDQTKALFWNTVFEQPTANLQAIWPVKLAQYLTRTPSALAKISGLNLSLPGVKALQDFVKQSTLSISELSTWAIQKPDEFEAFLLKIFLEEKVDGSLIADQIKQALPQDTSLKLLSIQEILDAKPFPKAESTPIARSKVDLEKKLTEASTVVLPSPAAKPLGEKIHETENLEIFVRNAGLVLLHPFLPALFQALDFAKNSEIQQAERAIQLLQYLAVGKTDAMEYELPLNKLLCGLPLDTPIRRQVRLSKKEKAEADKLLRTVIGYWSALGNTSIDGLRGTFFCREGKLSTRQNGDWLLQVEQRGVDILLADLPWGFSILKLPWMPKMIHIEWG